MHKWQFIKIINLSLTENLKIIAKTILSTLKIQISRTFEFQTLWAFSYKST